MPESIWVLVGRLAELIRRISSVPGPGLYGELEDLKRAFQDVLKDDLWALTCTAPTGNRDAPDFTIQGVFTTRRGAAEHLITTEDADSEMTDQIRAEIRIGQNEFQAADSDARYSIVPVYGGMDRAQ